jgi:hypothetical protein
MSSTTDLLEQLVSLEQQLYKFEVRSNSAKISKILGPEYYEYVSTGKVMSREDFLNRLPTEDDKSKIESSNFKITNLASDVALLTYIAKKINFDGTSLQYLRSSVWKNNQGMWQLAFHQGTIKN